LESEINHLEKKKHKNIQLHSHAKWSVEGETISKYWSKINSVKKPRDIVHKLRIPNTDRFATRSDKMADIARNHHEKLQENHYSPETEVIRNRTREEIQKEIPKQQKMMNPHSPLHKPLEEHHIYAALQGSKSGSAA
ncbi:hypothetical protein P692DRAFT_20700256, partial [Suillus brevipes Sb2]